jgi:hypothetical protein
MSRIDAGKLQCVKGYGQWLGIGGRPGLHPGGNCYRLVTVDDHVVGERTVGLFHPSGGPVLAEVGSAGQAGLTPAACAPRIADYQGAYLQGDTGAHLDDST